MDSVEMNEFLANLKAGIKEARLLLAFLAICLLAIPFGPLAFFLVGCAIVLGVCLHSLGASVREEEKYNLSEAERLVIVANKLRETGDIKDLRRAKLIDDWLKEEDVA
jgi:hypothetical protein